MQAKLLSKQWLSLEAVKSLMGVNLHTKNVTLKTDLPFHADAHTHTLHIFKFKPPATLLKVTPLHGCFSRFLICINGTKSRKASHIILFISALIKVKSNISF